MLDQKMIANARDSGIVQGAAEAKKRIRLLHQDLGFLVADRAEYVLKASCFLPSMLSQEMKAFSDLLQYFGVDYTLLRREHCCGNRFFRQAMEDGSEEELRQAELLFWEFLENNLRQIREAGANKIITFCQHCNSTYRQIKHAIPQEVLWYPTLLAGLFRGGRLELQADYYTGCHYWHRRLCSALPDPDSPLRILNQIEGLQLNHLDHQLCCRKPQQMESLIASIRNKTVITTCATCTIVLQNTLKERGDCRVVMLPQVVCAAVGQHTL